MLVNMKNILFSAVTLDVGGIETALVTLINYLTQLKDEEQNFMYNITLVLEKKQGVFLDTINKRIKIIEYEPNNNKLILVRKAINFLKQKQFIRRYKNKFDFSCCYATYSLPASFVARTASKNSVLWCHMDYLAQYGGDKEKVKEFFKEKHYKDFTKLVFVSEKSKNSFLEVFPEMRNKVLHINNLINYEEIEEKSLKKISEEELKRIDKKEGQTIFLNYGRHDELQKKISRLIEATEKLKERNKNFKVLLVGEGVDTPKYKKMVEENKLTDRVIFCGRKKNPFPYVRLADCVVLTSDYEGSPVVFTESLILEKPIITTDVAGSEQIKDKFGYVTKKDANDIFAKMEEFMDKGFKPKERFNVKKYNEDIIRKVEKIMKG